MSSLPINETLSLRPLVSSTKVTVAMQGTAVPGTAWSLTAIRQLKINCWSCGTTLSLLLTHLNLQLSQNSDLPVSYLVARCKRGNPIPVHGITGAACCGAGRSAAVAAPTLQPRSLHSPPRPACWKPRPTAPGVCSTRSKKENKSPLSWNAPHAQTHQVPARLATGMRGTPTSPSPVS